MITDEIDSTVSMVKRTSYLRGLMDGIEIGFEDDKDKIVRTLKQAELDIRITQDILRDSRIKGSPGAV
jgi:hypothetical protein